MCVYLVIHDKHMPTYIHHSIIYVSSHLQGVDDIAQTLAHLPAVLVADHRVQVHGGEGQLVGEVQTHHHLHMHV